MGNELRMETRTSRGSASIAPPLCDFVSAILTGLSICTTTSYDISPRASATRMVENTPKPQKPVPRDTLLFRLFNPELYIPYNRWIAGIGSIVCAAAIAKVAYLKYEFEAEKSRGEERR